MQLPKPASRWRVYLFSPLPTPDETKCSTAAFCTSICLLDSSLARESWQIRLLLFSGLSARWTQWEVVEVINTTAPWTWASGSSSPHVLQATWCPSRAGARGKRVFLGTQGTCGHEHSARPPVRMLERARLWPSQKQSYSLLLWKLLAKLGSFWTRWA